jgi:Secretion system C-terminal sorting domain/Pregnancy-associated plasma protein-A/Ig-like domain CHU_C associated
MKLPLPITFFVLFLFGQNFAIAQILCGIPEPTTHEKKSLLAQYHAFTSNNANKNLRQASFRVAVRANIVYDNVAKKGLTETDVRAIIARANVFLINSNIELYLLRDSVKTIINANFADFNFSEEKDLRAKYDVKNAINVYFLKNITQSDLSILNGYTSFPNLSAVTNRIFYAYNDRSADDFDHLYNKLFLHEMGHYFGLFHTFQDSNNPIISQRELVTRGAGSNCSATGDQLCDTSADPYDRLTNFSVFGCAEQIPKDLRDAFGDNYAPPVDNIMSYNLKCGNVFTSEQYQKMQASFAIRFSPSAEYQIIAQSPNTVAVVKLDKKVYCIGDSMKIDFTTTGLFDANNNFYVDISDKTGNNFTRIDCKKRGNQVIIGIPNFIEGDDYRVKITASRPETVSPISENFSIRTFPTASLSSKINTIFKGDSTQLVVNFTGSGTWTFQLSDGTLIKDTRQNPYSFYKKPDQNINYTLLNAKNLCGFGAVTGIAPITVIPPQISSLSLPQTGFCAGQNVVIYMTIMGKFPSNNQFFAQLSDKNGQNYANIPTQVSGTILTATLPQSLAIGTAYRIRITTLNPYSVTNMTEQITIVNLPQAPKSNAVNYCQNASSSALVATGKNLKWYATETDVKNTDILIPATNLAGKFTYFVSQSDPIGCESTRTPVDVIIKPLPTATISGEKSILQYDSTQVAILLTGDSPWDFTLSNNVKYSSSTSNYFIDVKPLKSTTYTLQSVKNSCGFGKIFGFSNITVLEPLSVEQQEKRVNFYPNPITDKLTVSIQMNKGEAATISILDIHGKVQYSQKMPATGLPQQEIIDFHDLATGIFYLKIELPKSTLVKKVLKN